ncbi:hypothetical protein L5515_014222 [Caenorhabditis briggsae]|uniref:Uncharacterized protein n=1 Tax=Caenorhabditis briggsae TaxID=6238 RepID=A0AAE9IUR5_CAEBR|nr:hypothetical protein L3Y34_018102 [Caenorhabditis briggsae]UMM17888.1 hypothetical protein L5515_014222 [Caenorhabditis briggsae]
MENVELLMDSEKEETVSSRQNLEEQQEENIPGSSPEGVFTHQENNIFEAIGSQDDLAQHSIPLSAEELKHDEENVDQQADGLDQRELIVEDGDQQYENMVQITSEDMYAAGFEMEDINNLTEEQLSVVVAISQERQAKQNDQEEVVEEDSHDHMIHHDMLGNNFGRNEAGGDANQYPRDEDEEHGHMDDASMHIILTHDGGVNITDSKQQQFYISAAEIATLNIDLNNLSHENVNQLLQIALPSMKEGNDIKQEDTYNREELDQAPSTSYHHHQHHQNHNPDIDNKSSKNGLIGETVQIRTADGQLQDAVVKYSRGNSEYKIQFMNGEFAYANIDQLFHQRILNDHDNYQMANPAPMTIRRSDVAHLAAQKRAAPSTDDLCPPVLKRSYHLAPVVDGPHHTPNFCCPICDKKVFQKEPSYIVIRLPACDSCTREKIIVLDEQNS